MDAIKELELSLRILEKLESLKNEVKYLTKGDDPIRPIERIRINFLLDEQKIGIEKIKKSIEYFLEKGESND